jgi:hypothetical protein
MLGAMAGAVLLSADAAADVRKGCSISFDEDSALMRRRRGGKLIILPGGRDGTDPKPRRDNTLVNALARTDCCAGSKRKNEVDHGSRGAGGRTDACSCRLLPLAELAR